MKKNYYRIRLAYNEGKIRSEGETKRRHAWRHEVKDLPTQERPDAGSLGYNKHFYEIMLFNEVSPFKSETLKFRMDVCDREDTRFTEDDIREFVALKGVEKSTAQLAI